MGRRTYEDSVGILFGVLLFICITAPIVWCCVGWLVLSACVALEVVPEEKMTNGIIFLVGAAVTAVTGMSWVSPSK